MNAERSIYFTLILFRVRRADGCNDTVVVCVRIAVRYKSAMCVSRAARRQRLHRVSLSRKPRLVRRLQPARSSTARRRRGNRSPPPRPTSTSLLPVHQDRLPVRRRNAPGGRSDRRRSRRRRRPWRCGLVLVDCVASTD